FSTTNITASSLQIGDTKNTGGISVAGDFAPAFATLRLDTSGAIDNAAAANTVTATNLALSAGTGIGATNAVKVNVTNLAARNSTSGDIVITATGSTSINTVDGITGVNALGGGGSIDVSSAGTLTVDQASAGNGVGNTVLTTTGASTNTIVLNANVGVTSNTNTMLFSAGTITGSGTVRGSKVALDSATGVGTALARIHTVADTLAARSGGT